MSQATGRQSLLDFTDAVGISNSLLSRVTTPANNVHFVNIDDLGFGTHRLMSPEGAAAEGAPPRPASSTKLPPSTASFKAPDAAASQYPMFSRFDPVELAGGVTKVESTEFHIPILPTGRVLVLNIISTWYVRGLLRPPCGWTC